ncbi:MAG: pentapeptide repeat-containing protein [Anaerolineae bacterium]|jgi:hypothetical protein|nr:pentapeptide repeat-containing protein [Anaerolineae bacterium]
MDMQIIPPELFKQMVDNHPEPPLNCENSIIRGVRLTESRVDRAFFANCRFENCVFTNCEFHKVQLRECEFKNCIFKEVGWVDSIFDSCRFTKTTFKDCRLDKVMFSKVDASYTNFAGCDFSRAILEDSDFREVNFTDAILTETTLTKSKLYNSQKCVFADIWPSQVEDIDISEFGDNSELTSDADVLVIHLTKEPRMNLGFSLGLPEETMYGSHLQLALELKDGVTEEEIEIAKGIISSYLKFVRGNENWGLIFLPPGILENPNHYVMAKIYVTRETSGTKKTWLSVSIPQSRLEELWNDYCQVDTYLLGGRKLYNWLAQIGEAVYREVKFDVALIGDEAAGSFYADELRGKKEDKLNTHTLLFPRPNGKLVYYSSPIEMDEEQEEDNEDYDDEEEGDDDLFG